MVSQNVDKIFQAVQGLTDAEKDELRHLLEARAQRQADLSAAPQTAIPEPTDDQRRQHRRRDFQPIELPGGPLSDDVIRDRR